MLRSLITNHLWLNSDSFNLFQKYSWGTCVHFKLHCARNNAHYTDACTCICAKYHHMQAQMHTQHTSSLLSNRPTCKMKAPNAVE